MWRKLFKSLREYKKTSVLTLIFVLCEVCVESFIPLLTATLVNKMRTDVEIKEIIILGVMLCLLACLALMFGALGGTFASKASAGLAKNLRYDAFSKIQTYSFTNIDRFSTASLVTRLTTDIGNIQMAYMTMIRVAVRSPLLFFFSVLMALSMGGSLAMTFLIIIPILGIGMYIITNKAMPAFKSVFKKYDKLNESVEENVRAMRVVKGFSREEYEKEKFSRASFDIRKSFIKAERIVAFNNPLMQLCMNINMIFILYIGSKVTILSGGTEIDVGQISAMITYGTQVLFSLMMLSMVYVMLTVSQAAGKRVCEVLEEVPDMPFIENPLEKVESGSIEFKNVCFKFSETAHKNSLSNINLKIESGMTVGIIGGTGSGKSSLVQLIPRLYDVTSGSILVGGKDVREYDIHALRDSVAMVLQKNTLFSGTVKENLMWGNENASEEEMKQAAVISQADGFISSFPKGYDTIIEQGGANVSGGQKQRICIARALLKKPKILILDDSTSAVDTKTDSKIREGLKTYLPDTTKIIIAQRISCVQDADMIVVIDNGRVSDSGTHSELLEKSSIYREVYEEQKNGGEENE